LIEIIYVFISTYRVKGIIQYTIFNYTQFARFLVFQLLLIVIYPY